MGIKNLSKLIADCAPFAVKETEFKALFGRKIAIDASMAIYQFLIAIRQTSTSSMMVNEQGNDTSHLVGLFYRTCKMLENGIKPIYVFDGKAPELKMGELEKRKERRKDAEEKLLNAETDEDRNKQKKRLVRVTRQHNEDCKRLLELLGCPVVTSPSEAEAQCAQLCKEGLVYAIATEDMDGLTFAAPKLIRNLSSGRADDKAREYTFGKVLEGLELNYDQFVDLCILMGCDYCESINGIGGKKGLELIRKYGSIENILTEKYNIHEFVDVEISYNEKNEYKEEELAKQSLLDQSNLNTTVKEEEIDEKSQIEKSDLEKTDKENQNVKDENDKSKVNVKTNEEDYLKNEESIEKEIEDEEKEDEQNEDEEKEDEQDEGEEKEDEKEDEKEESDNENISSNTDKKKKGAKREKKDPVPKNWLFRGARILFKEPNVLVNHFKEADLKFKDINEEGLIKFLVEENGFNEDRIRPAIERVKKSKGKTNQSRIDSFFKVIPQDKSKTISTSDKSSCKKRSSTGASSKNKRGRK